MTLLLLTGLPPLECPINQTYVIGVHACLSSDIVSRGSFLELLVQVQTCNGGVFTSLHELQRLRFCNYVTGSIIMVNMTEDVDPTIFWDISNIESSFITRTITCHRMLNSKFIFVDGIALIDSPHVTSIDGFPHLQSMGLLPTSWTDGRNVSLYIKGWLMCFHFIALLS